MPGRHRRQHRIPPPHPCYRDPCQQDPCHQGERRGRIPGTRWGSGHSHQSSRSRHLQRNQGDVSARRGPWGPRGARPRHHERRWLPW